MRSPIRPRTSNVRRRVAWLSGLPLLAMLLGCGRAGSDRGGDAPRVVPAEAPQPNPVAVAAPDRDAAKPPPPVAAEVPKPAVPSRPAGEAAPPPPRPRPEPAKPPARKPLPKAIETEALYLRDAYKDNPLNADEAYKGKWVQVNNGIVVKVGRSPDGTAGVLLKTFFGDTGGVIQCDFLPEDEKLLTQVFPGNLVTIRGWCLGKHPGGNVILGNCKLGEDPQVVEERKRKAAERKEEEEAARALKRAREERKYFAEQRSEAEKDAALHVAYVKRLLKRGETDKARKRLEEILRCWPKTEAAKEANELLATLKEESAAGAPRK